MTDDKAMLSSAGVNNRYHRGGDRRSGQNNAPEHVIAPVSKGRYTKGIVLW
jgi:hypothetical protein